MASDTNKKGASKSVKIASAPKPLAKRPFRPIASIKWETRKGAGGQVASFLIKAIALEAVRRVSRAKCPFLWNTLQGLQVLCYPPLKWIQCWNPFGFFVKGMQSISQPLLVLSIVNAFSDRNYNNFLSHKPENSPVSREPQSGSESVSELPSHYDQGTRIDDGNPRSVVPTDWLNHIFTELENQGFALPERITLEQLHRYYVAANGDTSSVLSSLKRTIRWRETYRFLSAEELEVWSNFLFWHGLDVKNRPCLFVRVGLACTTLSGRDRALFAQAMGGVWYPASDRRRESSNYSVSGLSRVVTPEISHANDEILFYYFQRSLPECFGVSDRHKSSPSRPCYRPHFHKSEYHTKIGRYIPNKCPYVPNYTPGHPFIDLTGRSESRSELEFGTVLKPSTKQRVRMEGDAYQKLLSECFETLPSYLGGKCTCRRCLKLDSGRFPQTVEGQNLESSPDSLGIENLPAAQPHGEYDMIMDDNYCSRALRDLVMVILILLVLITFMEGMYNPESRPFQQLPDGLNV